MLSSIEWQLLSWRGLKTENSYITLLQNAELQVLMNIENLILPVQILYKIEGCLAV